LRRASHLEGLLWCLSRGPSAPRNLRSSFACYEFTSRDVAEALEAAAHRGVKVRIVADWKASHDRFSQIAVLQAAGISVRLDRVYAIMHNKFMVIDGDSLETGSFNYTTAADKHNAENALGSGTSRNSPRSTPQSGRDFGRSRSKRLLCPT
jgi:hypothetical protein